MGAWWDEVELERRYLLDRAQTERFLAATAAHLCLAEHHHQYPVAYTRTTYLDTADAAYLRACDRHSAGRAEVARRLRIREYAAGLDPDGPAYLTGIAFLELKENMGAMRKKRRFAAPPGILAELVRRRGMVDAGRVAQAAGALAAIQRRLERDRLHPCLMTWYRRWSFHAPGAPIRVTLDEGLAYCRPWSLAELARSGAASRRGALAAPADVVSYGPGRVLEIKLRGHPPAWLAAALAELPRTARFSKFQTGMRVLARIGPPERSVVTRPISIPRCMAPQPS